MSSTIQKYLASIGKKGGSAGTGKAKRRDAGDPDYYKRISGIAAAKRKENKLEK
jgi:hypothetical protein